MWGACHLPTRSPPEQSFSAQQAYMSMGQMENMMPPPPPDSSKAPGYRSTTQRMVNSPIGMAAFLFNSSSFGFNIQNNYQNNFRRNKEGGDYSTHATGCGESMLTCKVLFIFSTVKLTVSFYCLCP